MKIVIDIPEDEYRWIKKSDKTVFADVASKECMLNVIKNGTPLIERPKGEWIDIRVIKAFHYDGEPRVKCSRCGNEEEWSSNYCPNCGAEMNGGKEDEVSN